MRNSVIGFPTKWSLATPEPQVIVWEYYKDVLQITLSMMGQTIHQVINDPQVKSRITYLFKSWLAVEREETQHASANQQAYWRWLQSVTEKMS